MGLSQIIEKWYTAALGFATTVFAVMLEDITWFLARVLNPLSMDQLGGLWIQASDWTARWSSFPFPGGVIPTWYCLIAAFAGVMWICIFQTRGDKT